MVGFYTKIEMMTKLSVSLLAIYNEILEISPTHFLFFNPLVCKNVSVAMSGYKDIGFNGVVLQKDSLGDPNSSHSYNPSYSVTQVKFWINCPKGKLVSFESAMHVQK